MRERLAGRMQYAPTRVHKNASRFEVAWSGVLKYAPLNGPIGDKESHVWSPFVDPVLLRERLVGRMQYAPTRVHKNASRFKRPSKVEV